ncbi:hypothetical protein EV210_103323 [Anaerospora hongkongensis]|uniref:Uncharacterized protein n=2 Tax=Anaerospora hongkongensis TaxID=244830 RepID=A0A4V2Q8X0_9FIRM|nr:hypothetical protein [Anaerospora hongkongensis]TCL38839.1 hypothetical protein EV210_103323 [Anaerospora hongkongensis]
MGEMARQAATYGFPNDRGFIPSGKVRKTLDRFYRRYKHNVLLRREDGGREQVMLKTVYGPPPADEERIEATDLEMDSGIREEEEIAAAAPEAKPSAGRKELGKRES